MTTPTHITDHADRAKGFQLSRFLSAVRLKELTEAISAEIQDLEDLFYDLLTDQLSSTAVGKQLDRWGRIVRLARTSASDAEYLERLRVESLINCSSGGTRVIQEIAARIVGATVRYRQVGRAHYLLDYEVATHTTQATRDDLDQALLRASCSGVSFTVAEAVPTSLRYDTGPGYDEGRYGA
jgi:hypothetical protein